eukprot:gene15400-16646_t
MAEAKLTATEEKAALEALLESGASLTTLKLGETRALVSVEWWNKWYQFTGFQVQGFGPRMVRSAATPGPPPGPIDNTKLLDKNGKLGKGLAHNYHYCHKVIAEQSYGGAVKLKLELALKKVKIFMIDDAAPRAAAAASGSAEAKFKECGTLEASNGDTVAAVQAAACALLGITAELIYSQCGNTPLAESGDTGGGGGGGDGAEVGGLGDAASHVRLWDFTPKKLTKVLDATMTVAAWCKASYAPPQIVVELQTNGQWVLQQGSGAGAGAGSNRYGVSNALASSSATSSTSSSSTSNAGTSTSTSSSSSTSSSTPSSASIFGNSSAGSGASMNNVNYSSSSRNNNGSNNSGYHENNANPSTRGASSRNNKLQYSNSRNSNSNSNYGAPSLPGVCGLRNLGNTCYMNSSLQCLSNMQPLTQYFLQGRYCAEVNTDNPLGCNGELAERFAELLRELWSGKHRQISPAALKDVVGRHAAQFQGFNQHDSQELLGSLLDGLHEDLNRIRVKPMVPPINAEGRPDVEVAAEAWMAHLLRNDSIIVDLFHGQLKSTVVCPQVGCGNVSVTFDPMMTLSLPLTGNVAPQRSLKVTMLWADPDRLPTDYGVKVPKDGGSIFDLKEVVSAAVGIPPVHMLVKEIMQKKIYTHFNDSDQLKRIRSTDTIYVYEVDPRYPEVQVVVRAPEVPKTASSYSSSYPSTVAPPFIMSMPADTTCAELKQQLVLRFRRSDTGSTNSEAGNGRVGDAGSGGGATDEAPAAEASDDAGGATHTDGDDDAPAAAGMRVHGKFHTNVTEVVDDGSSLALANGDLIYLEFLDGREVGDNLDLAALTEHHQDAASMAAFEAAVRNGEVGGGSSRSRNAPLSLEDCMRLFKEPEVLAESNSWFCSRCQQHLRATKILEIWKLPEILIVQLKRF